MPVDRSPDPSAVPERVHERSADHLHRHVADKDIDPDIPSMIGSSAALAVSGLPFNGPIAGARVGYKDGQYLLNPGYAALKDSRLNMVVAGTEDGGADGRIGSARADGRPDARRRAVRPRAMQVAIKAIKELAAEAGKPRWEVPPSSRRTIAGRGGQRPGQSGSRRGVPHDRQAGAAGASRCVAREARAESSRRRAPQFSAADVTDCSASSRSRSFVSAC